MSLEKFLQFLFAHNATIIEMLLGLTLLVVLFLSIRMFLTAKEPAVSSVGSLDLGNLETTLKQILEKAGQIPATTAGASEDTQKLVAEIANLKHELQLKQKAIEEQSSVTAPAPAASGMSADEKAKLEAQLNELQAKLSEYEIISEDIADLSFYKEQNAKLQKDIEALKAGGVAAASAVSAPAAAPTVAEPLANEDMEPAIVGRSKVQDIPEEAAPASTPAPETPAAAPASTPAPAENLVDDDLMAEFAAAVEKQKAPAEPSADVPAELGEMNMDKMLAEAAEIKTDVPDVDPEKALGTTLDESKLLQEAAALEGVTPEDKRLMGEFENFVKKSES